MVIGMTTSEKKTLSILDIKKQTSKSFVVEKEISFTSIDGEECTAKVFVKKLSYSALMDVNKAYEFEIVKGEAKYKGLDIARLQAGQILHSICMDKTGKKLFNNIDEIYELIPEMGFALHAASDEVNNFSGKSQTKSSESTSSGVNSSSTESVEEQSKSASETSATEKQQSGESTEKGEEALM